MTCTYKRNKDFRMTNPMHLHANRNKNYKSENMKKFARNNKVYHYWKITTVNLILNSLTGIEDVSVQYSQFVICRLCQR